MRYRFAAALFVVVAAVGLSLLRGAFADPANPPSDPVMNTPVDHHAELFGLVTDMDAEGKTVKLELANGTLEDLEVPDDAAISLNGQSGKTWADIRPFMLARVSGERDPSTLVIAAQTTQLMDDAKIYVAAPDAGATVTSPIVVEGFADVSDNTLFWRVRDADGTEQANGSTTTHTEERDAFGTFQVEIFLPALTQKDFILELYDRSRTDDSEQDLISLPLRLLSTNVTTLDAFFPEANQTGVHACDAVFPLARSVAQTSAVARASLRALVDGLTDAERASGYVSALPMGFAINAVALSGGRVTVDVNETVLRVSVCQQKKIYAQIKQTLLQFPGIDDLTITIDGDPDRVFAP